MPLVKGATIRMLLGVSLFLVLVTAHTRFLRADYDKTRASEHRHRWVSEANKLLSDLNTVAQAMPKVTDQRPRSLSEQWARRRRSERILWKLWLATGKPPEAVNDDETSREFLLRIAGIYRRYVAEHAHLNEEQLHRLGLQNAIQSIRSPLWHMTLRYVKEKAGLEYMAEVHTTPSHAIVKLPASEESYDRLAAVYSRWLNANSASMKWDPYWMRFRPKSNEYIQTNGFDETIINAHRSWTREMKTRQKLRSQNGKKTVKKKATVTN